MEGDYDCGADVSALEELRRNSMLDFQGIKLITKKNRKTFIPTFIKSIKYLHIN